MVRSSQSCLLDFLDFWVAPSCCPPSPAAANGDGDAIWLAWMPLSLCMLAMLLPSSSVSEVSAILGGLVESPVLALLELLALFICCIS